MLILTVCTVILAAYVQCGQLASFNSQSLMAYSSNKGEKTYYQFQFTPSNSIESNASIEISFPKDFDYVSFPKTPECYLQKATTSSYQLVQCTISKLGIVNVQADSLSVDVITLVVGKVINPMYTDTSSQFSIKTYYNDVVIDSNEIFGFVSFAEKPKQIQGANVYKLSNGRISEGSSWEFHFTPVNSYSQGNSFRFTFPDGFTTNKVICDIQGLTGNDPNTTVLFNKRIITCQNILKSIQGDQVVKILNMKNPDFSGIMQGFTIEILQGSSTVVLEKIEFGGNIIISPGEPKVSYVSSNQFKWSNSTYSFFINLINPVYQGDKLFLNFTSEWNLFNPNCTIINGFQQIGNQPVRCSLIPNSNSYQVENFALIDSTQRLVLSLLLETPRTENLYPITISTYNTKRSSVVDLNTLIITINSTYGVVNRFVAHPLKQPQVSLAGKTGSLEMTFFLKTFLPKSDVDSFGKFRVDIFPQIQIPPSNLYGPVKCFFYGEISSANECSDVVESIFATNADLSKTTIYIQTPKDFSYQQSEVPITITTTGLDENYYKGFVLDPLVQRYYFHVHIWSRQNTGADLPVPNTAPDIPTIDNTIPDEVYFSEYIPTYRVIDGPDDPDLTKPTIPNKPTYLKAPNLDIQYRDMEANQFTYLTVTYTHQDIAVKSYTIRQPQDRNYIMRVYFISGWATGVGYTSSTTDQIIKNFPCLIKGNINDSDSTKPFSNCDLFIGTPYPYLQVNNLQTLKFDVGTFVSVVIPRVKLANSPGVDCYVNVEIDEETPGFREDIVIVYKSQDRKIFKIAAAPASQTSGLTFTPSNSRLNFNPTYSFQFTQTVTTIDVVVIDWDSNLPISFAEVDCTGTSGTITCVKFASPVWQIYATGPGIQQGTVNIKMPLNTSVNPAYEKTMTFVARAFATDKTIKINKIGTFYFPPLDMTVSTFSSLIASPNYFYQGYVSSHLIKFTLQEPVPDNWYIQLDFFDNIVVNDDKQFLFENNDGSVLQALDNRGILLSFAGSKFVIWNLKAVAAAKQITINLALTLPLQSSCNAGFTVKTEYVYGSSLKRVNKIDTVNHADKPFTLSQQALIDFKVLNPINYKISPYESLVAPFNFIFKPDVTLLAGNTITLRWIIEKSGQNGFSFKKYTSSGAIITIICSIGGANHPCSSTEETNYIVVTITLNASLVAGTDYNIQISTDIASDQNGLNYPKAGGYYEFRIETNTPSTLRLQKFVTYIFIRPQDFTDLTFAFGHTTASTANIYEINFILNRPVSAYSSGGRLVIYFPIQQGSKILYASDLGYGSSDPGCWFSNFVKEASATKLQCILKKAGTSGTSSILEEYNARIEVINFQALTAGTQYQIIIGKIQNPGLNSSPFDILFMTYNIDSQYKITYQNSMIKSLFINETSDAQSDEISSVNTSFNDKVQDTNKDVTHQIKYSSSNLNDGDFFITEYPSTIFTSTYNSGGNLNQGNINTCDTSKYYYCISMDEIKWVIWKIKTTITAGSAQDAYISLKFLPKFIQRATTSYYSYVYVSKKYKGKITETIPISSWNSLKSTIASPSMNLVNSVDYYMKNRLQTEIIIQFTTSRDLFAVGAIEIKFDSSYIPYAHCRSNIALGSKLYSSAGNNYGDIGCTVQSNSWYLTGFQDMTAGNTVYIQGLVDLPTSAQSFNIYTYGNQLDSTINSNGYTIEEVLSVSSLAISSVENFQFDTTMALIQASPLRVNYVGDLRIAIKSSVTLNSKLQITLAQTKLFGTNTADGFQSLSSIVQSIIGYAIKVSDGTIIPFLFDYSTYSTSSNYITMPFTMKYSLSANTDYILVITTQQLDSTKTDGIIWPQSAGIYSVEVQFPTQKIVHTEFVEVYGPKFTTLNFYSTNNGKGESNLIYIELQPTTPIAITDLLFIEFNTKSLDSINLFDSDLGLGLLSYTAIPTDFVQGITSAKCRIYNGFQTQSVAARIVCSEFSGIISAATTVRFFFTITNPSSISEDTYIPILVYFTQPSINSDYKKVNWQIVEQQFNLKSSAVSTSGTVVTPTRSTLEMGVSNVSITFQTPVAFAIGDMLIVDINTLGVPTVSTQSQVSCTQGTMFLLSNNKKMACLFTSVVTASTNIVFQGTATNYYFYNPYSTLSASQMVLKGLASYLSDKTKQSVKITCNSMSQLIIPTTVSASDVTVPNPVFIPTTTIQQYVDVLFEINSINLNLVTYIQYTHSLTGITLDTNKKECLMAPSSNVEIIQCYHDGSIFYLKINPASVATTKKIQFVTRNKPVLLPSSSTSITYQPIVKFYNSNNDQIFQSNIASTSISPFTDPSQVSGSFTPFPQGVLDNNPELRYFDQEPFYLSNTANSGPIVFSFCPQEAISSGQTISFVFGNLLKMANSQTGPTIYSSNVEIYKYVVVCKINGIIQTSCTYSSVSTTSTIAITIASALAINTNYNFYIDATNQNQYPLLTGFFWSISPSSQNIMNIEIQTPTKTFYSDLIFFGINQTYKKKVIDSTTTISYVHKAAGEKNLLTISLVITASTTANLLIIEFESFTYQGTQLFNSNTMHNLSDGAQFPCSGGTGSTPVTCWIKTATIDSNSKFTQPIRIFIKDFSYTQSLATNFYLFIENPKDVDADLRIRIKSIEGANMYTMQGQYEEYQVFRTVSNTRSSTPIPQTITVDKPYTDSTASYGFLMQSSANTAKIYVLIPLSECTFQTLGSTQSDMIYYLDSSNKMNLLSFTTSQVSTQTYSITNMQCNPTTFTYYESESNSSWRVNTGTLSSGTMDSAASSNYFSIVSKSFFPIKSYTSAVGTLVFISSNSVSLSSGLSLDITFWSGISLTACAVRRGLYSGVTDTSYTSECTISSSTAINISQFTDIISNTNIELLLYYTTDSTVNLGSDTVSITLKSSSNTLASTSSLALSLPEYTDNYLSNNPVYIRSTGVSNEYNVQISITPSSSISMDSSNQQLFVEITLMNENQATSLGQFSVASSSQITVNSATSRLFTPNFFSVTKSSTSSMIKLTFDAGDYSSAFVSEELNFTVKVQSLSLQQSNPARISQLLIVKVNAYSGSSSQYASTLIGQILPNTSSKLLNTMTVTVSSGQVNKVAELLISSDQLLQSITSSNGEYIVIEFAGQTWPDNIISGISSSKLNAQIDCLVYVAQSLKSSATCYRHYKRINSNSVTLYTSIITARGFDASSNQKLEIFIPQITTPTSISSWDIYVSRVSDSLLYISTTQSLGAVYINSQIAFQGTSGSLSTDTISISNLASLQIGTSTLPLVLSLGSSGQFLSGGTIYIQLEKQSTSSYFLDSGSFCSSFSYTYCRLYTAVSNIIVYNPSTNISNMSVTLNKALMGMISYSKFNDKYAFVVYYYYGYQHINSGQTSFSFSSISFTAQNKIAASTFSLFPIRSQLPTTFYFTVTAPQALSSTAAIIFTFSSSNFTPRSCHGFYRSSAQLRNSFYCSTTSTTLNLQLTQAISSGQTIEILASGVVTTTSNISFSVEYYYSYSSSTSYYKIGTDTVSVTNTGLTALNSNQKTTNCFKMLSFYPIAISQTLTSLAPVRIKFQHSTDIDTSFSQLYVYFFTTNQFSDSNTSGITTKSVFCTYKKINSDGTFEFLSTSSCQMDYISVSSLTRITASQPLLGNNAESAFSTNTLYELIINSNIRINTPGFQMVTTSSNIQILTGLQINCASTLYGETTTPYIVQSYAATLQTLYYTSKSQATDTSIYIQIDTLSTSAYPTDYLELIIPDHASSAFTSDTNLGQTIKCDLYSTGSALTLSPFCIVNKRGNDIVIKILSVTSLSTGSLQIAIDDITLLTSANLYNFSLIFNSVSVDSNKRPYNKNRKVIDLVFQLSGTASTITTTPSMTLTNQSFGSSTAQLQFTSSQANILSLNSNDRLDKVKIKLNNGMFALSQNQITTLNTANFCEIGSTGYTSLWVNTKTQTFYGQVQSINPSIQPSIRNLKVPNINNKIAFETSPSVVYTWYVNHIPIKIFNANIATTLDTTNFSVITTSFAISTATLSTLITIGSTSWLTITLSVDPAKLILANESSLSQAVLTASSGIDTFYECLYIIDSGLTFSNTLPCEVSAQKVIKINNVKDLTAASSWKVYVRAKILSDTFQYDFSMYQYIYTSGAYVSLKVWQFTSSPTTITTEYNNLYSLFTQVAPAIQKYFSNYYERQIDNIVPGFSTLKEGNFQIKTDQILNSGDVVTFTLQTYANKFIDPTTKTLFCIVQQKLNPYQYGFGRKSDCTHSSGVFSITTPIGTIPISTTVLYTVRLDVSQTGTFATVMSTPQRQEIEISYNSKKNVEIIQLKNPFKTISFKQYTNTPQQWDYLELTINLNDALPPGSSSQESTIYIEFPDGVYPSDLGLQNLYALDSITFQNGQQHDFKGTTNLSAAKSNALLGYSTKSQGFKFAIVAFSALAASTGYTIQIPLIYNGSVDKQIILKVRTQVWQSTNQKYPITLNEQIYIKNSVFTTQTVSLCSYAATPTANGFLQQSSPSVSIRLQVNLIGPLSTTDGLLIFKPNQTLLGYNLSSWASRTFSSVSVFSIDQYPSTQVVVMKFSSAVSTNLDTTASGFTTSDEQLKFAFQFFTGISGSVTKSYCDLSTTQQQFASYTSPVGMVSAIVTDSTANNKNSNSIVVLTFNVRKLLAGSVITISLGSYSLLSNHYIHAIYCSTTALTTNTNQDILLNPTNSNTQIEIKGFGQVASGAQLVITLGVKTQYSPSGQYTFDYQAVGPNGGMIEAFRIGTITMDTNNPIGNFKTDFQTVQFITPGTWGPIQIKYKLRTIDINYVNSNDQLKLTIPSDFTLATGGVQNIRYQQDQTLYWVDSVFSTLSSSPISIKPPLTPFDMIHNIEYNMLVETKLSNSNNNGWQYPSTFGYYKFLLTAWKLAGSAQEFSYDYYLVQPEPDQNLQEFQPLNRQAGDFNVFRFKWKISVAAVAGDEIWIEFMTNNGAYNDNGAYKDYQKSFMNDLGTGSPNKILDCVEGSNANIISASKLFCDVLYAGDDSLYPPNDKKAVVRILITQSISANQIVEFFVGGVRNPIYDNRRSTVTVSLRKTATQTGFTIAKKIPYQISPGEFTTTPNTRFFSNGSTNADITYDNQQPTPNLPSKVTSFSASGHVWDTQQTHSWQIYTEVAMNANDWILVVYTLANTPDLGTFCQPVGECYVFNSLGWVIKKVTGTTSDYKSFSLTKLNNGLYRYAGNFKVQHWKDTGELQSAYNCNGLTYNFDTTGMTIAIRPTLTPQDVNQQKYWLTDFWNVAQFNITKMWKYTNIRSFWVYKPTVLDGFDVSKKYCNATLQVSPALYNPYPWRFNCQVYDKNRLYLETTDDFDLTQDLTQMVISLYSDIFIKEFTSPGLTDDFVIYSSALKVASDDQNYGVTQLTIKIDVSPYLQPDLRDITFNSVSFKERKAQANDLVEFYMLLQPMTALSLNRIDKMVFRIPNEFNYAPVKNLDSCSIKGKVQTPIISCELQRSYGYTYVTVVPDSTYDNTVKIVRLSDSTNSNLFQTPNLPGNFYNVTVDLYANNALLEQQTINITRVLGYAYSLNSVKMTSHIDPLYSNLFYFESKLGNQDIQPGYDSPAAIMYTSLEYTFDNNDNQFLQDLGTGLKTGDQIPCLGGPEITMNVKKRLSCYLTIGTGPQNPPTINVFGYDKILAGTVIRMYFPLIQTLDIGLKANTYTSVRIYYKWINHSAIFYESKSVQAVAPTAANTLTVTNVAVTTSANNLVGQTRDYTFSFALSGNLATTDYLIFDFPQDYFDRNADYSGVTCTGYSVLIFSVSNQIFLQPAVTKSGTINIIISGLINPAYSQNDAVSIQGYQYSGLKIVQQINFQVNQNLNQPILPCNKFTKAEVIVNTNVGGINGAVFTINFISGHYIPAQTGALSVFMPDGYPYNFYEMETVCNIIGLDERAVCLIGSATRMDIYLNGNLIEQNQQYSIILTNVNTIKAPSNSFDFVIQSYYSSNIYLQQIICQQKMTYPTFSINSVSTCAMIVSSTVLNANTISLYTFKFQCNNLVRDNTFIEINLPVQFKVTNTLGDILSCFSNEPTTLRTATCLFLQSDLKYIVRVNVQSIQSQSLFSISVYIRNPKAILQTGYSFSANFYSFSILYAQASIQSEPIVLQPEVLPADPSISAQVSLTNIPKNAGQKSTYVFTIPPLIKLDISTTITKVQIQFPTIQGQFATVLGDNIECGLYLTDLYDISFLTYQGLLQMTNGRDQTQYTFTKLSCQLISDYTLSIDTTKVRYPLNTNPDNLKSINTLWQHWIIRNVINPKQFNQNGSFQISYFNVNSIQWQFIKNLQYQISKAPQYLKIKKVSADNTNIRVESKYQFDISSQYQLPQNPLVGISLSLPSLYQTVASLYTKKLNSCDILKQSDSQYKQSVGCDIYNLEILAEQADFVSIKSDQNISLVFDSLINPNIEYTCSSNDSNQFDFKIIDWNSGDLLFVTSPSIDDRNCLSFQKTSFDINVIGPLVVNPGLSYSYTLTLEKLADNLQIRPNSPVAGIIFDPEIIDMSSFSSLSFDFFIKYRSDILAKDYVITFDLIQKEKATTQTLNIPSSFYLPVLPLTVKVVSFDNISTPTVKVENLSVDSIGYPIRIPVNLSASSASTLFLSIKVVEEKYANIIIINPPLLQIDANVKQAYFTIELKTFTVPNEPATLSFSLTSYYTIVHKLFYTTKYISFSANRSFSNDFSVLSIVESYYKVDTPKEDLDQAVINQAIDTKSNIQILGKIYPKIMQFDKLSTTPNTSTFIVYSSTTATITFTFSLYGSAKPNSVEEISGKTYKQSLGYGEFSIPRVISDKSVLDYFKQFTISKLQAQTNYQIHYYIWNQFGPSDISTYSFKTAHISFGSLLSIPISKITPVSDLVIALSKALQINPSRIISKTDETKIQDRDSSFDPNIMLKQSIYYDFVIAPNSSDDTIQTSALVNQLKNDADTRDFLSSILPQFDLHSQINSQQIISAIPKVDVPPHPVLINYNNATFSLRLWDKGYIYAVVREVFDISETEPPVSIQIFNGLDEKNNPISSYKLYQSITDSQGYATISIDDLNDGTDYKLYITIGSYLPYKSLNLLEDEDIMVVNFSTPFNINVGSSEEKLSILAKSNPELAEALNSFLS